MAYPSFTPDSDLGDISRRSQSFPTGIQEGGQSRLGKASCPSPTVLLSPPLSFPIALQGAQEGQAQSSNDGLQEGNPSRDALIGLNDLAQDSSSEVQDTPRDITKERESRLHEATLRITPSLFSLNMGTGIVSILLYNFPYQAAWLRTLGIVIFAFNVVLFILIAALTIGRYLRWRGLFGRVGRHPSTGMFWGCLPMGFATIVNMVAFVLAPINYRWAKLALGLWWIDVVMSIVANLGMIFMIFSRQTHDWTTVSATWLLPIVASVVAAASGAVVSSALSIYDPSLARSTVIVAYVVWGTGVPLAGFIMTLWIARTAIHGLPTPNALCSVFLPLGPCGQGSFGILLLGKVIRTLAYEYSTPFGMDRSDSALRTADVAWGFGILVGLILWGLGFCWYTLGHLVIFDHMRSSDLTFLSHTKFSVGMWALTFPLGVFTTATYQLAIDLDSQAFRVIGAFQAVQVVVYWAYVFVLTGWKVYNRSLFVAPELEHFDETSAMRWRRRSGTGNLECSATA